MPEPWHVIVIGANPAGLSAALDAQRSGADRVLVLEPGDSAYPASAIGRYGLSVRYQSPVDHIEVAEGRVVVASGLERFQSIACLDARALGEAGLDPTQPIPPELADRVHTLVPDIDLRDEDVLVVGNGERAVTDALRLEAAGARVVIAFSGKFDALSRLAREELAAMERDRRATVLWRSMPDAVEPVDGFPMAFFDDRRTPDLQFDHVIYALEPEWDRGEATGPLYRLGPDLPAAHAWELVAERHAADLPPPLPAVETRLLSGWQEIEALRDEFYNATITYFDHSHQDLWVLRVRPDVKGLTSSPGQYATLGLGYWEPRVDDAEEGLTPDGRLRMIRRSYSISSRIFDQHGYLIDEAAQDEIEFYIVHVRPRGDSVPALTPRLADKRAGDRIYLGPKVTGRYTLDPVTDPFCDVAFLATGTGEAPHNAMITDLLRRGHVGDILAMVTVRELRDLAYVDVHRQLEERYRNYNYLVLPTREPGVDKRYIQDVVRSGELADRLGHGLDPDRTHVFLCGNPAMIGLPEWTDDGPQFPAPEGVSELLHRAGFRLDHRREIGNIHYEEYW